MWLENRARGAQQCEQRLVQLHSAINSIDAELCASLDQDLYGDELPELCQVILKLRKKKKFIDFINQMN